MRLDTKLENRGKVVLSPLPCPLYFPPFHPAMADPQRHTGTFSHSFSVPSLTCTETDDDDDGDDNDDGVVERRRNIYQLYIQVAYCGLFIHFGILFITLEFNSNRESIICIIIVVSRINFSWNFSIQILD